MIVIRYLRDAACGTVFPEKMKLDLNGLANGATEMTVRLLEHNNEANETSIQAVGWIGEKGNAKACFQLLTGSFYFLAFAFGLVQTKNEENQYDLSRRQP